MPLQQLITAAAASAAADAFDLWWTVKHSNYQYSLISKTVMSVLNSISQLGLLIVLSLITHNVPVMQTLSPQYLKLISARLCLINNSISAFFCASLLRLSVKTREAELNRRSLATDVGGACLKQGKVRLQLPVCPFDTLACVCPAYL